jgi:hypothetical protein
MLTSSKELTNMWNTSLLILVGLQDVKHMHVHDCEQDTFDKNKRDPRIKLLEFTGDIVFYADAGQYVTSDNI